MGYVGLFCDAAALPLGTAVMSTMPAPSPAHAQGTEAALRGIMSELGAEYLRLTSALLTDDFKGLEESARAIRASPRFSRKSWRR
jgi:hypothetical protein